ncbi:MAG TPA: hypothetical protein DD412_04810 [Holosporales bacterium]|nr:hypothetical protein [Holosporales bacterium]
MTPFFRSLFLIFFVATIAQPNVGHCAKKKRRGPVYAAIVIDDYTGTILHKTNVDSRTYPASLTKVMTLYLLFEALKHKKVTLNTKMKVSKHASKQKPSKLWLKPGTTLSVRDALLALTVKSANDVAAVVAEHLGGSEKKFANLLTKKARALGMRHTTFKNASGMPNRGQVTTARDMATMFRALHRHFPDYYRYFKHKHFTFRGQKYRAHTRLLGRCHGVDGVKTGFINASGFNLVASAKRENTRLFAVVMGGKTGAWRDRRIENLINKYFPRALTLNKNRKKTRPKASSSQKDMLWVRDFVPPHKPHRLIPDIPTPEAEKETQSLMADKTQFETLVAQGFSTPIIETDNASEDSPDVSPEASLETHDDKKELLNAALETPDDEPDIVAGLPSRHDAALLDNIIRNENYDDINGENTPDKTWAAQFGAFTKESEAQSKADLLVTLIPNLPGTITVTPAKHRRTPLYRARLVNITKEDAEKICKKMRFHDIPCLPLKN